ncbi:hypothetical protein KJ652_05540 [Patescibacteria group bacterium]|nr:hypothetical protein [Patescibacteria group bacterium]MBU1124025.1 hypothetical protein [Patescibacteria group bacterium]MBU1911276.1 hypothetical protein [Patescibacteria group bacterium]
MLSPDLKIPETKGKKPDIPKEVQIGDIIVGKYTKSEWSRILPWEDWDHSALVANINPLIIVEASGIIIQKEDKKRGKQKIREGIVEYEFLKPRTVKMIDGTDNIDGNLWLKDSMREILWLHPVFPNPLREIDNWETSWKDRKIITETEARKRAVEYARNQLGEPFKLSMFRSKKSSASKWDENEWYCSLLVFKSYSRTVTNMYLESYEPSSGFFVTPEDLVQSKRSAIYHHWKNQKYHS